MISLHKPPGAWLVPLFVCVLAGPSHGALSAWHATVPSYPPAALAKRITGTGVVRVTTDEHGWVKTASMVKSTGSKVLDDATVDYARNYWQGPHGVTANLPIEYRLPPPPKTPTKSNGPHVGWTIPRHDYPSDASDVYEQGSGVIKVTTDFEGRVKEASVVSSTGHARLDADAVQYARSHWRGPPSTSREVPVVYRLNSKLSKDSRPRSGNVWLTPKPFYPQSVLQRYGNGSGVLKVSTDAAGKVTRATMIRSTGNADLDENTANYAVAHWSGPPNSQTHVPITYRIAR